MRNIIVKNCPCIRIYKDKATCLNGFHQCITCTSCSIKAIIESALMSKISCDCCNDDSCEDCKLSELVKFSNNLLKQLKVEYVEDNDGD